MNADRFRSGGAVEPDDALPRTSTGNAEADRVLGGGFPSHSINVLMGAPGTGKTLFAEQLLFANATGERPVLFVTTLSEPLSKVVTYLQRLAFYDAAKLGSSVIYDDIGSVLASTGPEGVVPWVRQAITSLDPKIIVIDSFKVIHDLSSSVPEIRRLIADLAGLLSAHDVTTFLVGEYDEADIATYPEFAVADGIVEFARHKHSNRDERFIRVSKLRGSGYLEGLHGVQITAAGLEVYPRLVSPPVPADYAPTVERLPSGIDGLDAMIGGGLWRGSSTLVIGPTGSGKTTMGLQWALSGVAQGEPTLYVNFQENPTQLARSIQNLTPSLARLRDDGLHLLYASSVELQIDRIIVEVLRTIESGKIRRVVIDAIGDLAMAAADVQRVHDYLYAFVQQLAVRNVTVLLLMESPALAPGPQGAEFGRISYMCDNVILLDIERGERLGRHITVYKTRGSAHDERVRRLTITAAGVRVE